MRKAERIAQNARICRAIGLEPDRPIRFFADRFGVSYDRIYRICKSMGVKLPRSEYLNSKKDLHRI